MTGPWRDKVFNAVPATALPEFPDQVARCYPFHPQLMALAEQEWAKLAGFQRVRSTIRIFAATAHSLHKRGRLVTGHRSSSGPGTSRTGGVVGARVLYASDGARAYCHCKALKSRVLYRVLIRLADLWR